MKLRSFLSFFLAVGGRESFFDRSTASATNPATPGEPVAIYGMGLFEAGRIPPQVMVGGRMAQVLFFGDAPGYPSSNQINVIIPKAVAAGDARVRFTYLDHSSGAVMTSVQ